MAFPTTAANLTVQFAPGANPSDEDTWAWEDITSSVRVSAGVATKYGRRDEGTTVDAAQCSLWLNNVNGQFSRFNANSTYFGRLGPNTPLRVRWTAAEDAFTRSTSNGWGTADSGQLWTTAGGAASDYSTTGTVGRHSTGTLNVNRKTVMPGPIDTDLFVSVSTSVTATGAALRAGLVARYTDASNYYAALLIFNADQTIALRLYEVVAGSLIQLSTVTTALTHVAGAKVNVRFQILSQRLRAKAWQGTEPAAWTTEVVRTTHPGGATFGCWSRVETGNTNTLPVLFDFDDFRAEDDRFIGFVSEWPPRWDLSGNDAWVPITALGTFARLRQRDAALRSSIYREVLSPPTFLGDALPIEYWPLEDRSNATSMASALDGGVPAVITGDPQLSSDTGFLGSEALPKMATGSKFTCYARPYTVTNEMAFRFVVAIPAAGYATDRQVLGVRTTGTASLFKVDYLSASSGTLQLRADTEPGTQILSQTMVTGANGARFVVTGKMTQSGPDVGWAYDVLKLLDDGSTTRSAASGSGGLMNGRTIGAVQRMALTYFGDMPDTVVGHLALANDHDAFPVLVGLATGPWLGWVDETAGNRIARLCDENDIPFLAAGTMSDTTAVGAQRALNVLDLLAEAEAADGGVLHELGAGLAYLPRTARYNQAVTLALSKTSGHIAEPPEPTDDDQQLTNDLTVTRVGGSSARVVDQPHIDKAGLYDDAVTLNVATDGLLPDVAAWLVHLGTVDAYRWPRIDLNLARSASLIPAWLAFRIGGRATIAHDIVQLPGIDVDLLVDGWTEIIRPFEWRVELNAVPAAPWNVGVLDDAARRWETQGSQLNAGITTTATSLSVATTVGPLWTTTAGHFPFGIVIGGERMTVTNITGGSSPQTFTVTRSVNGIVKAHSAGAAVTLHPSNQLLAAL